jgi:hypothetical protein
MKIIKNEKLIERNGKIGQYTSLGALAILGAGMYISFTKPEWFTYSIICLLVGFALTQVGMYMGNRWGRSPRPDEKIDSGLKGLHSEFNMYHYSTPASHFLVGPSGAWVLLPYHQHGKVEFKNNRWRLSGGGFLQSYMRIFGQEGLGKPEIEARAEIDSLKKFFAKNLETSEIPEIKAVLVFTSDDVEIDAVESPMPAMKLKQLKDFMRQESKTRVLNSGQIEKIAALFPNE